MANTQLITRCRHLLATALLLLSGAGVVCAQQWHTTIELSHPAEISLPLEVSDLLLVNNTVAHPDLPTGAFYTLMAAAETLEGADYLPSRATEAPGGAPKLCLEHSDGYSTHNIGIHRDARSGERSYPCEARLFLQQPLPEPDRA